MTRDGRVYSDAEMRRILEQASAPASSRQPEARTGYTLAEIRAVAREVGIEPDAVDRAASTLDAPAITHSFMGLPLTLQMEIVAPRKAEREDLRSLAARADATFGSQGAVTWESGGMQWFNERERAFVGVAPEGAATRVRVITDLSGGLPLIVGGIGIAAVVAVLNIVMNADNAADLVSAAVVGVVAVGGIHVLWARRTRAAVNRIRQTLNEALALLTDSAEAG